MGEVVELHAKAKDGEARFMLCSCEPEGVPFTVIAIVAEHPIVATLVGPSCEKELPVLNGIVRPDLDGDDL